MREDGTLAIPEGEAVTGMNFVANYSKLVERWNEKGLMFRPSAVILQGNGAVIDNVGMDDAGALGSEAFPFVITGAMASQDRARIPLGYVFDADRPDAACSHITNYRFGGYRSSDSNAQVTIAMIVGSMRDDGPQNSRKHAYVSDFKAEVRDTHPDQNQVQAATIYQSLSGEVTRGETWGLQAGYYSDYMRNRGVRIHHNRFLFGSRGVALMVAPAGPDVEHYGLEDFTVEDNVITQAPTAALYHAGLLFWKLAGGPDSRFIRNVKAVRNSVTVEGVPLSGNAGIYADGVNGLVLDPANTLDPRYSAKAAMTIQSNCTGVVLPPSRRRGCNPFG